MRVKSGAVSSAIWQVLDLISQWRDPYDRTRERNASNISIPRVRTSAGARRDWAQGTPAPAPGPLFESDSAPRKAGAQGPTKRKGREYVTLTAYAATRRKLYVVLHGEV